MLEGLTLFDCMEEAVNAESRMVATAAGLMEVKATLSRQHSLNLC